jgi:hypothetical protein
MDLRFSGDAAIEDSKYRAGVKARPYFRSFLRRE